VVPSREVRWFHRGPCPAPATDWFDSISESSEAETRTDFYLLIGAIDSLGIKVRAGTKVEVKLRQQDFGLAHIHERVEGRIEYWTKWSFDIDNLGLGAANLIDPPGAWVAVEKTRRSRQFEVASNGSVMAADVAAGADEGCTVELTSLIVRGQAWWSLALEAFGLPNNLGRNLDLAARRILAEHPVPLVLLGTHSYSYPKWLQVALTHS
jgi:hypothetical protein